MVEKALGPRPLDGDAADLWNEGVNIIYSRKYAEASVVRKGGALGPEPPGGGRRADYLAAERRLALIHAELGLSETPVRTVEADMSLDL